ncbi:hypothetical protein AB0L67_31135 [Streptomyces flaveolus]|uniref:hypothetical protein n=1 Tax=Streptomyces flaveolus TaxID=67297 RepID=UPI00341FCBB0
MIYDDFTGLGYGNTTAMKHTYQKWGYRDNKGKTIKKYKKRLSVLNKSYNAYYKSSYYKKQLSAPAKKPSWAKSQVDARKKDVERRKKDGIFGNLVNGNWGGCLGSN